MLYSQIMASDSHAHPFDLQKLFPYAEDERQRLNISCASSSWNEEQFLYHEKLSQESKEKNGTVMLLCFGVHPQLPKEDSSQINHLSYVLQELAEHKRLHAIGETGFDYFDEAYRKTGDMQKELFLLHLHVAKEFQLPIVLHIRKAMNEVFYYAKELASLPAVIFHSYSGTFREAEDILKRKVNAYFSFGTSIALNHKRAMEAASLLPPERILTETDAPYQPLRNSDFSSWKDIYTVIQTLANLRRQSGRLCQTFEEVETQTDVNFRKAFFIE
jgi:TatD DNase family protein